MTVYSIERANGDSARRHQERHAALDTEVIASPSEGPRRIVCLCSYQDAVSIAAALAMCLKE